ncbi:uncharacterized protein LOC108254595 isoform X1 [Diaphorina citri]|uniref:Uncharacterized protein LOC108254595 isoform X1 n=1 Tax=Diaphorina citri TaxID=121845 RepID=A0A1S4ESS4_DIACI|nr:uncharacterized protein LOC108254595 isoform X1 [Diaphorina citri]
MDPHNSESAKRALAELAVNQDKLRSMFLRIDFSVAKDATSPSPTDWTTDDFKTALNNAKFQTNPPSSLVKKYCRKFLNCFFDPSLLEPKIFKAILAGMSHPTDPNQPLMKNCSHPSAPAIEPIEGDVPLVSGAIVQAWAPFNENEEQSGTLSELNKMIEELNLMLENESKLKGAINFLGFYILHCIRLSVKDEASVCGIIRGKILSKFKSFYPDFNGVTSIGIPTKRSIKKIKLLYSKTAPAIVGLIPLLIQVTEGEDAIASEVFRSGCMISLSCVGLGAISWFIKAFGEDMNTETADLIRNISDSKSYNEYMKVINFLGKLETNAKPGWKWCRLISEGALLDLSTRNNINMAAVCACISAKDLEESRMYMSLPQFDTAKTTLKNEAVNVGDHVRRMREAEGQGF